ncbi:hypothetical protein Taro_027406 [Colocasia esculenta]|uniref:Uncharacterized protein n=1 Tax=Colocasia esculenta TaxID=4460 RepID=A0A843VDV4_COLES|nr:hypothetical protein [Colocasia esculenta]
MLPSPVCACVWFVGDPEIEDPVGLPPYWWRDCTVHCDISRGVAPVGHDLIAAHLAVAIRRLPPFPGTPILRIPLREVWDAEGFGVLSWHRLDNPLSHCLSLCWFRRHVVVSGIRLQLGQAVVPVFLVVPASMFSRFRGPVLGCQPVMAPACVASRPGGVSGVRGGSAYGPSTLCAEHCFRFVPDSVGFYGSRFLLLWPVRNWLQLLLCRMRGECGRSSCSCRSGAVGTGLAGSGLPCVEDACESVQAEVHRLVALCSGGRFRELFVVVLNGALVVLVEVLPGPACVASAVLLTAVSFLMRALADGGLVSADSVWRAVLLMEASVSHCGFASCVWKRLMRVSFLFFSSVARGGGAPLWCCVAGVRIVVTFRWIVIEVVLLALTHQGVAVVFTPYVAESVLHRVPFGGTRVVSSRWCRCAFYGESFLLAVVLLWPLVHLGSPIGGTLGSSRGQCPSFPPRLRSVCDFGTLLRSSSLEVDVLSWTSAVSEFLTGVSCVAVDNCILCRVLLATERVADWLVLTARSAGGFNHVVFSWRSLLFGLVFASLGTYGVVVPPSRSGCQGLKAQAIYPFPLSLHFFPFPSSPAVGRLPSDDQSMVASAGSWWRLRGPSDVVTHAWSEEEVAN